MTAVWAEGVYMDSFGTWMADYVTVNGTIYNSNWMYSHELDGTVKASLINGYAHLRSPKFNRLYMPGKLTFEYNLVNVTRFELETGSGSDYVNRGYLFSAEGSTDGWQTAEINFNESVMYNSRFLAFIADTRSGGFVEVKNLEFSMGGHQWLSGTDDDTYFIKCDNTGCVTPGSIDLFSIVAPEKKLSTDDKSPAATVTSLDAFNFYINDGEEVRTAETLAGMIQYWDYDYMMNYEAQPYDTPPTDPGFYTAMLDYTALGDLGVESNGSYLMMWVYYAIGPFEATYGDTLGDIALPDGITWDDGDSAPVGAVGTKTLKATYTYSYFVEGYHGDDEIVIEVPFDVPVVVSPKPITVNAVAASKTEGETDPALTYTVEGLVSGDTLNGTLARVGGEVAGTYAIQQGTVTDANNPNYKITFNGADFTINAKPDNPPENPDNPPENPDNPPVDPGTPENSGFRCQMCPMYEKCKDIEYFGWVVSLVHIFVHLAAHIGYLT